jgi:hypothetical protein
MSFDMAQRCPSGYRAASLMEKAVHVPQTPLYQLLYTSSLAPTTSVLDIARIARASRARNAGSGITGTLIFDGQRFCHYLEGQQSSVLQLAQRIAADTRHVEFVVRAQGPFDGCRRFAPWSLGYALAQDAHALDAFAAVRDDEAISTLLQVLPRCEPEP